ncbi:hypothetical protein Ddye_020950 [Dipteronia dyeriana]|uniref:Uncharacterized protein n=1 Tax=Dipteronia dyeriana TaxID=168575 RepID=A0AAD9U0P5_9ROSI|nr:hypothetical protein Ddye_020950 [Dipteronia dyeriana]
MRRQQPLHIVFDIARSVQMSSDGDMAYEPQVGEDEGIDGLRESIFGLHCRNMMNVDHILNYPSENDIVMESSTDEEIIQRVMNTPTEDQDPDDINVLPSVSSKELAGAFSILLSIFDG